MPYSNLSSLLGYDRFGTDWNTRTGQNWDPTNSAGRGLWTNWLNTAAAPAIGNWERRAGTTRGDALTALGGGGAVGGTGGYTGGIPPGGTVIPGSSGGVNIPTGPANPTSLIPAASPDQTGYIAPPNQPGVIPPPAYNPPALIPEAPPTPADNTFNIPGDVFNWSRSGLPPETIEYLTGIMPDIISRITDSSGQDNLFREARSGIQSGYADARNNISGLFKNALQPALQDTFNSLAGRNMMNSSVAGEALSQTASTLGDQAQSKLAAMSLEEQKALATLMQNQAGQQTDQRNILTNLLNMGRVTESRNEWDPMQYFLDLATK